MIYLYLFGTCFHFIYVFMIIDNIILAFNINGVYNIDWFNTMATEKNIISSSSIDNLKKYFTI